VRRQATLEPLETQLAAVEQQLFALCAKEPVITLLSTIPGVGSIVAARLTMWSRTWARPERKDNRW